MESMSDNTLHNQTESIDMRKISPEQLEELTSLIKLVKDDIHTLEGILITSTQPVVHSEITMPPQNGMTPIVTDISTPVFTSTEITPVPVYTTEHKEHTSLADLLRGNVSLQTPKPTETGTSIVTPTTSAVPEPVTPVITMSEIHTPEQVDVSVLDTISPEQVKPSAPIETLKTESLITPEQIIKDIEVLPVSLGKIVDIEQQESLNKVNRPARSFIMETFYTSIVNHSDTALSKKTTPELVSINPINTTFSEPTVISNVTNIDKSDPASYFSNPSQ